MSTVTLREAQARLAELVHRLAPGEGVTITENDRPVARLEPVAAASSRPVPWRCRGMLTILAEDDKHLEDWAEFMP